MLNHDLLFSVLCCFLLDRLINKATCNVMVDHLQSLVTPWRQYASHVKVRGTLWKKDVLSFWPVTLHLFSAVFLHKVLFNSSLLIKPDFE